MDNVVNTSLNLLGLRGKDKVTGFAGMISSVCFDAYGCVQILLTPPMKDGKLEDAHWFDMKRVETDLQDRAMTAPGFHAMNAGEEAGGNDLPAPVVAPLPY